MLIPYLAYSYKQYVEKDTWRIYFRAISSFLCLIPPILALIERPSLLRFVVSPIQSLGGFGVTLILIIFTVLFGVSNAAVLINSGTKLSDATLELSAVGCGVTVI